MPVQIGCHYFEFQVSQATTIETVWDVLVSSRCCHSLSPSFALQLWNDASGRKRGETNRNEITVSYRAKGPQGKYIHIHCTIRRTLSFIQMKQKGMNEWKELPSLLFFLTFFILLLQLSSIHLFIYFSWGSCWLAWEATTDGTKS